MSSLAVEVAVAAPLWHPLTYLAPSDLAPLIQPLTRLTVPIRGRPKLGFALCRVRQAGPGADKLKMVMDVLDDPGSPCLPGELLPFFTRAAAHYQVPLGQALAWALPSGLGAKSGADDTWPRAEVMPVLSYRQGRAEAAPRQGTQAKSLLELLAREGPKDLAVLREVFPRAAALIKKLEAGGWLSISHRPLVRDLLGRPLCPEPEPQSLTPDQARAWPVLKEAVKAQSFLPFLIDGVTGSGKTELYLAAINEALAGGRSAIILTPEIGLCLRLEGLLRSRFSPEMVAVIHSGLTPAQRRGQWRAIAAGRARIVAGARSAVFAPLRNPGVICVDEEQDEAYKQQHRLRYHARDLALLRGQEQSCPVLLGSATPAVTTWSMAREGDLGLLTLPRRVKGAVLPSMEVVDLRSAGPLRRGFLSDRLHQVMRRTVNRGQQAVLFLNRRGFAPALICQDCGKTLGCPACSLSLTWHQATNRLACHACGHTRPRPDRCPTCQALGARLQPLGLGTESVAQGLQELEPGWHILRLDSDSAGDPKSLRKLLQQVQGGEVDVIVGTQMITKGHHFPKITCVGVLLADQALAIPDFRASERAYTLLTQVAGRAGREQDPGRVVVQTYDPGHPAIAAALAGKAEQFYLGDLAERRALGYPPFMRLVALRVEGPEESTVAAAAQALANHLDQARERIAPGARILGPAPAAVPKVSARYRQLILIKAPRSSLAGRILHLAKREAPQTPRGVRVIVDVDPVSLA